MSLLCLPDEILCIVSIGLAPHSREALALTCKSIRDSIRRHMHHVQLHNSRHGLELMKDFPHMTKLTLSTMTTEIWNYLSRYSKTLQILRVDHFVGDEQTCCPAPIFSLQKIKLNANHAVMPTLWCLEGSPNLLSLKITLSSGCVYSFDFLHLIVTHCPRLEFLLFIPSGVSNQTSIAESTVNMEETLVALCHLPVRHLTLSRLTDEMYRWLLEGLAAHACTTLEEVHLSLKPGLEVDSSLDPLTLQFYGACRNLKTARLEGFLTESWHRLMPNSSQLPVTYARSRKDILQLVHRFPKLEVLSLHSLDENIPRAFELFTRVTSLSLHVSCSTVCSYLSDSPLRLRLNTLTIESVRSSDLDALQNCLSRCPVLEKVLITELSLVDSVSPSPSYLDDESVQMYSVTYLRCRQGFGSRLSLPALRKFLRPFGNLTSLLVYGGNDNQWCLTAALCCPRLVDICLPAEERLGIEQLALNCRDLESLRYYSLGGSGSQHRSATSSLTVRTLQHMRLRELAWTNAVISEQELRLLLQPRTIVMIKLFNCALEDGAWEVFSEPGISGRLSTLWFDNCALPSPIAAVHILRNVECLQSLTVTRARSSTDHDEALQEATRIAEERGIYFKWASSLFPH